MSSWEAADWFEKWLELARIDMAGEAAEHPSLASADGDSGVSTSFDHSQLFATEDNKLAA
jgi:hypothetical protein